MTTWEQVIEAAKSARNVQVRGKTLYGNDGLVLTFNPYIALGYVKSDWDAVNCCASGDAEWKDWPPSPAALPV